MFGPQSESVLQGAGSHARMRVLALHCASGHDPSSHEEVVHVPVVPTTWQVSPLLQSVSCVQLGAAAALRPTTETPSKAATARVERRTVR